MSALKDFRFYLGWCPKPEIKGPLRPAIRPIGYERRDTGPEAKKVGIEHQDRVEAEELWVRSKYFFALFGVTFAITGIYRIFQTGEIFSGILTLILAIILPLAFYRGHFVAVIVLIWGGFLAAELQVNAAFIYGTVAAYVIAKEIGGMKVGKAQLRG